MFDCVFGFNEKSWSLICFNDSFTARHNNESTVIFVPLSSNRVGVYLDWSAGCLSFYSVSDTNTLTLTHLHTFNPSMLDYFFVLMVQCLCVRLNSLL